MRFGSGPVDVGPRGRGPCGVDADAARVPRRARVLAGGARRSSSPRRRAHPVRAVSPAFVEASVSEEPAADCLARPELPSAVTAP